MSLIDFAENYNHNELSRTPALTDGVYTLLVDTIVTSNSKHAGAFVHLNVKIESSEDIVYADDTYLFGGKKPETKFPSALKPDTAAHLSFKQTEEYQRAAFFQFLAAVAPEFKGTPEEQKPNAKISDETKKRRKEILKNADAENQPYKGYLLKVTISRRKARGTGNPFRVYEFVNIPLTAEELAANRAELS